MQQVNQHRYVYISYFDCKKTIKQFYIKQSARIQITPFLFTVSVFVYCNWYCDHVNCKPFILLPKLKNKNYNRAQKQGKVTLYSKCSADQLLNKWNPTECVKWQFMCMCTSFNNHIQTHINLNTLHLITRAHFSFSEVFIRIYSHILTKLAS